ncbi:MAG: hypothetical protein NZ473_03415 [Candidatus Kapabacteria bacterium]|nr:hypothetical protein [Candidatus Kapabacteria bacterium]MDW8225243.1 hypothetical protein [Bacteroidota bacterium]
MKNVLLKVLLVLVAVLRPANAQSIEYVTVHKASDDRAILLRADGTAYLVQKGAGCPSLERYEGRQVVVISPGLFLGVGSKLVIPELNQECRIWDAEEVSLEYVMLYKVEGNHAILIRDDLTVYLVQTWCPLLWLYEGKYVIVISSGFFLGVGSKLLTPDLDKECSIWSVEEIRLR